MHEKKHLLAMAFSFGFVATCAVSGQEENQLWKIQKLLASKNYVDLTHEFDDLLVRQTTWERFLKFGFCRGRKCAWSVDRKSLHKRR